MEIWALVMFAVLFVLLLAGFQVASPLVPLPFFLAVSF